MKKHVFGFALFGFIFVSFAFGFALFRTTQISIERKFKPMVVTGEEKTFCPKRVSEAGALSHEVISSYFFYDEERIVSKIRVSWNRTSPPPGKISVSAFFAYDSEYGDNFSVSEIIENPFAESNERIVTISTDVSKRAPISRKANIYVHTFANESDGSNNAKTPNDAMLTTPVVFVHGASSVIKK